MVVGSSLLSEQNLILTGYIEPNKPRVARQIAEQLSMKLVDIDQEVEARSGMSPDRIRADFGERQLSSIKTDVMEGIYLHRNSVIRVSGDMLTQPKHVKRLQSTGVILMLVARLDAILHRIHVSLGTRYHNPDERAIALGQLQRAWLIRGQPGIRELDTTGKTEDEIIDSILTLWQEIAIRRS